MQGNRGGERGVHAVLLETLAVAPIDVPKTPSTEDDHRHNSRRRSPPSWSFRLDSPKDLLINLITLWQNTPVYRIRPAILGLTFDFGYDIVKVKYETYK